MAKLSETFPRNRRTDAFERRVASSLEGRIAFEERLVIACSGGPDSVALLVSVRRAMPSSPIIAAYFDHQLRSESETQADAAFVRGLAENLSVEFVVGCSELPLTSGEASARIARYRWLGSILSQEEAVTLLTGHTRDDQAETVLLKLARGTGLRGARGMRVESPWPVAMSGDKAMRLLRPLLVVTRSEIDTYLSALSLEARSDSTNKTLIYARNRVRHRVLPALQEVNSEVREHLARFADRADEASSALEIWAGREFAAIGIVRGNIAEIERLPLRALPVAIATNVLEIAASRIGLELNARQIATLLECTSRRGARCDLADGFAWTDDEKLLLQTAPEIEAKDRNGNGL